MQIANVSGSIQIFADKSGKDVEIAPGGNENIDIDRDDVRLKAAETAGLVIIGGTEKQAAKRAAASGRASE